MLRIKWAEEPPPEDGYLSAWQHREEKQAAIMAKITTMGMVAVRTDEEGWTYYGRPVRCCIHYTPMACSCPCHNEVR